MFGSRSVRIVHHSPIMCWWCLVAEAIWNKIIYYFILIFSHKHYTGQEPNGDKTKKEVSVLDVWGKLHRNIPVKTHAVRSIYIPPWCDSNQGPRDGRGGTLPLRQPDQLWYHTVYTFNFSLLKITGNGRLSGTIEGSGLIHCSQNYAHVQNYANNGNLPGMSAAT